MVARNEDKNVFFFFFLLIRMKQCDFQTRLRVDAAGSKKNLDNKD